MIDEKTIQTLADEVTAKIHKAGGPAWKMTGLEIIARRYHERMTQIAFDYKNGVISLWMDIAGREITVTATESHFAVIEGENRQLFDHQPTLEMFLTSIMLYPKAWEKYI